MKTYEGMFLLDAGQTNFEQAVEPIRTVLDRSSAEIVQLKKWDERRLAYEIKGRRRGLYVLSYFKADPESIGAIERDVQLNEQILRVLILSADHVDADKMAAPTPAEAEETRVASEVAAKEEAQAAEKAKAAEEAKPAEEAPAAADAPAAEEAPADAPAEEAGEEAKSAE